MRLLFVTFVTLNLLHRILDFPALCAFRSLLLSFPTSAGFHRLNRKILACLRDIGHRLVFCIHPSRLCAFTHVAQRHTRLRPAAGLAPSILV